ncbi:hypothetical protein [Desulfovibrio cuneatus]|uniref:hypothetical protein n=1 Tax=Desulfovibrio cuneatus TaxID=159728 RepID=UPI0003FECD01|nr:hypothetical protein [Desulfovibrio cuneatus]
MTTRHFCTYFDHNYLPRGMVMLESLHAHCPQAIVHVLCLSDQCHAALAALKYPFVRLLRLAELEAADKELLAVRPTRSLIEYYFTLTPCLPWHLLHTVEGIDAITYLDADMLFFSSPEPIFEEAGEAAVVLTPHKFSRHIAHLVCWGIYNVSWLTFANTQEGLEALEWYRSACLEWCGDKLEGDRFADQKYLDTFPTRFKNVHIMQHAGGGLAPWNIADAHVEMSGGSTMVDGVPLVFYHAHGFKHIVGPYYSSGLRGYQAKIHKVHAQAIFTPYVHALNRCTNVISANIAVQQLHSVRGEKTQGLLKTCKWLLKEWLSSTLVMAKKATPPAGT